MKSEKKISVLLTGGGGAATPLIAQSFKRVGGFRFFVADAKPLFKTPKHVEGFYTIPFAADHRYLEAVRAIVEREKIEAVIPGVDEELPKYIEFRKMRPAVSIIMPSDEFVLLTLNKLLLARRLEALGIRVPKTYGLDEFEQLPETYFERPIVMKPICGRGSRGLYITQNYTEAKALVPYLRLIQGQSLIQEKIEGEEYTISVLVSVRGGLIDIVPKRIICKRGITIEAVTVRNKRVIQYCAEIVNKLDPQGPFNVQLMVDRTGEPFVFEINPRISTTTILTSEAGVEEIPLAVLDARGKKYERPRWEENVWLARRWENIIERRAK